MFYQFYADQNPTLKGYPRPLVTPIEVIIVGYIAYFFASLWPPSLLVAAAFLAVIYPNLFYERDDAESRRRLYREFLKSVDLPEALKCKDVKLEEKYWVNSRGMCLSTSIMKTKPPTPIRAVVCFCHGFLGSSSYLIRCEYQRYVKAGVAFVTIDYEGHGLSDGLHGLIPSWELLVADCAGYFRQILEDQFPGIPAFLCGESMGGAVCFSVYERNPSLWKGVVFVAPMCKIKNDMLPPPWVIKLFMTIVGKTGVTAFSKLPIAPSKKSLLNDVFRSERKKGMAKNNPLFYGDRKPRLASARELLKVSDELSSRIKDFDAPFLVQHGLADVVTDPNLSKALYEESPSKDKSIKLYEGMWHSINIGESDENLQIVHQDAIDWILKRS